MLFDLIVIGSGPAGQKAALQAARAGKRVAVIENSDAMGGGCLHWGTMPSKSFRESVYRWSLSSRGTFGREREDLGAKASRQELPDMARLLRRRDRVVEKESQVIREQFEEAGIRMYLGHARFVGPNDIEVESASGKRRFTASFVIIATGARPVAPEFLAVDGRTIHDSNTILSLKKVPRSMIVLGAGIIGCEYASIFSTAGTKVTLVDRRNEILASVDREIVDQLQGWFEQQKMEILLETEAVSLDRPEKAGSSKAKARVQLSNGRKVSADVVLVALGRHGNTRDLGLESVGIQPDERGLLKVDSHFRTSLPHVYAVGDVIGSPALASTSMEQGRIAACHAFRVEDERELYEMPEIYPYGIYTIPEMSMVGRTEEDCRLDKGLEIVVGRAPYREVSRGQIVGDRWGLLKIIFDRKTLKLLGVHVVGDSAANLVHIGQAVMQFGGDLYYFINSVFNYPTLAEAYKLAARDALDQIRKSR
jgi:NAD(P) transhydrogenase